MRSFSVACFVLAHVVVAGAQQIGVQQPVVSTNSVRTTVSVPDRGSALLGGVGSAQSGRSSYGPLRSGSSLGMSRSASSMSTSVYIHDLRAMDEALLNSVADSPTPSSIRGARLRTSVESRHDDEAIREEKRAKFERLAQRAEAADKPGVAKLHWQVAAKYGSKLAGEKLTADALVNAAVSPATTKDYTSRGQE